MRMMSGNIRLLVVDEPTSAMDPEGELQLFERLRNMREGKTTVFVTHRFGHLTKHADLILWVTLLVGDHNRDDTELSSLLAGA